MKFFFFFILSSNIYAFTLSNSNWFNKSKINIEVAGTTCSGAGITTAKLQNLIKKAAKDYWNAVPTSAIELKVESVGNKDIAGMSMSQVLNTGSDNSILAGCNDSISGFDGSSEPGGVSGTLGVGSISCPGGTCRGAFVLNAHATGQVSLLSESELVATIAHEIGHAIGLGHSEYKHNLMYYSIGGKTQKWLGEDDIDGVNYLYPHDAQLAGLLGACGTISTSKSNKPPALHFLLYFLIGFLLVSHFYFRRIFFIN